MDDSKGNNENYLDSLLRSVMKDGQQEQDGEPEEILDEIPEEPFSSPEKEEPIATGKPEADVDEPEELSLENELSSFLEEIEENRASGGQTEYAEEQEGAMAEDGNDISPKDTESMEELMKLLSETEEGGEETSHSIHIEEREEDLAIGAEPEGDETPLTLEELEAEEVPEDVETAQEPEDAENIEEPALAEEYDLSDLMEEADISDEVNAVEKDISEDMSQGQEAQAATGEEPGKMMSQDDIESLLASMEIDDVGEEDVSDDEMASFLEQFPELGEGELDLAGDEKGQAAPEGQDMKDTDLMDLMAGDEDLDELSALLKKDDNNELLEGVGESAEDGQGRTEEAEGDQGGKAPKKKRKLFGKKKDRKKKKASNDEEGPDNGEIEGTEADGQEGADAFGENAGETVKAPKEPGFFGKLSQLFFEEIGSEDEESGAEKKPKKEKGKKKKKDENQEILDEMAAEDEANKKKGKKEKKGKKDKKEKKNKKAGKDEDAETAGGEDKEPEREEQPGKKIPVKKIVAVGLFAATLLGALLLLEVLLPGQIGMKNARRSYAKGDYRKAYETMLGMDIKRNGDRELFEKSKALMNMQRRLDSYQNYRDMGKETKALDALIRGIKSYGGGSAAAQEYGVLDKYDGLYQTILNTLYDEYGLTEDLAKEVAAIDDSIEYTILLTAIAEPDVTLDLGTGDEAGQGQDTYDDVYEDLDAEENGAQAEGQEGLTDMGGGESGAEQAVGGETENADAAGTDGAEGGPAEEGGDKAPAQDGQQGQGEPTGGIVSEPADGSVLYEFKVDKDGKPIEGSGDVMGGGNTVNGGAGAEAGGADGQGAETDAVVPDSSFTDAASPL